MSFKYDTKHTAVLLVDPYNDFFSEGGKVWDRLKDIATKNGLIENIKSILSSSRTSKIQIFYVPHRRWEPGDYESWSFPNPTQQKIMQSHTFAKGTWGGEFRNEFAPQKGDIIIKEHWGQSGFANTDLDQQFKQHGISHVIIIGLLANTCIESTARFAMELGYHVTLVKDGTAAYTEEMMHAAHVLNGPTFAHSIVDTKELMLSLK